MVVLLVPLAIALFVGILVVADVAERRSTSVFLVRSSLRSQRLSCEETEAVVAAGLAPCLEAAGMHRDEAGSEGGSEAAETAAVDVDEPVTIAETLPAER